MPSSDPSRSNTLDPSEPTGLSLSGIARLAATGLGLVVIVVGLWAVLKVFLTLMGMFATPDKMAASVAAFSQALAGVEAAAEINGQKVDLKAVLVVGSFWLGWIVVSWLSVSLLLAGAKIISWTTTDHEAVKRVLAEALGNWRKLHERE